MSLNLIKYLFLPPTLNVVLVLLGLILLKHYRRLAICLITLGLLTLILLSTPVASHWLRKSLEPYDPPTTEQLSRAEAIVVLGGGRDYDAQEFGWGDAPNNATWRRLGYAAWLARQTQLPILVTGGRVHGEPVDEATLMALALRESFGLEATWIETRSHTTAENAAFSAPLLQRDEIRTLLLVSQAWHLPRAVPEFVRAGFHVIPAPTEFVSPAPPGLIGWIPRAYYLRHSAQAIHEWLGRYYYRLLAILSPSS